MHPTERVLTEAWELYQAHWRHFVGIALVVYVVVSLAALALSVLGLVGAILASGVSLVGVFWLQGALVKAVEDVRDGRVDLTYGETFAAVRPYLGRIIGAGLLAGLAIAIGFVFLILPGLLLLTIWAVIVPAIVLEGRAALDSFGRSFELVRPHLLRVLGMLAIALVVMLVVQLALSLVLFPLGAVGSFIVDLVSGLIIGPWLAVALTLLYYRLGAAGNRATA